MLYTGHILVVVNYSAIHSMGGILSLLFVCLLFVCPCMVTDFSVGSLPIGLKFCMVIRPDLGQAFSYFGGITPGMAEFWVSTACHMAGYDSCIAGCISL